MAKVEEALLLHEPPVVVKVLKRGNQVSLVQLPDGRKENFTNEWLVFDVDDDTIEEFQNAAPPPQDDKPKPITGRHGKVPVDVNGQSFDSVRRAFNELKLPLREKSRVRRSLRAIGTAVVKYSDTEFKFTRIGKDDVKETPEGHE